MIRLLPISHEDALKIIQRGIRSISYSLITKAHNEQDVIDYILRKDIVSIPLSYGTQAHAVIGNERYQHPADIKSYINENNKVFLSYHHISETMLMKIAIENHKHYRLKHLNKLVYEKKMFCILEYSNYQFLCKAYIDAYNHGLNTILEFKTTASAFGILNTIDKYNYDLQAYIYHNIILTHYQISPDVEFFFLNKQENHNVAYIPANNAIMSSGEHKLHLLLPKMVDILIKYKYLNLFSI